MVDLVALRAELDKPAYTALGNAEAAVAVMAATLSADRRVPSAEVARLWARRGVLANAREAGERGANAAARALGWRVIDIVQFDVMSDKDTANSTDRGEFDTFLGMMVSASIMSAGDRSATVALISKPRAGREVFGVLDENDVAAARAI